MLEEVNRVSLENALSKMRGNKIIVLGDVMIDAYILGDVSRISPEAPVPVLRYESESFRLGGASNVAFNLKQLGLEPLLFSVIGDDKAGGQVKELLEKNGIASRHLLELKGRKTALKTRLISGSQQLLRMDREDDDAIPVKSLAPLFQALEQALQSEAVSAVLISDYAKGLIHEQSFALLQKRLALAKQYIALDPCQRNFQIYKGLSVMTPNKKEASADSALILNTQKNIQQAGELLMKKHSLKQLIITLGAEGMALFEAPNSAMRLLPAFTREIRDVSGAGDTVISVFSACFLSSGLFYESAYLANLAAGVSVSHAGTYAVSAMELLQEIKNRF